MNAFCADALRVIERVEDVLFQFLPRSVAVSLDESADSLNEIGGKFRFDWRVSVVQRLNVVEIAFFVQQKLNLKVWCENLHCENSFLTWF
jgi:hypothetical protein